jgi:hypothetical protein
MSFADEVPQKNPTMLVNIEEAELEADPLHVTSSPPTTTDCYFVCHDMLFCR